MLENLQEIGEILTSYGFDIVIVFGIITIAYLVNIIFKPNSKIKPLIVFFIGILIGVLQILIIKTPVSDWLRNCLGYPAFSIAVYMLIEKYWSKKK